MKLGVDTSVLVAALHANHPFHLTAAEWLNHSFENHEVIVAHHSVLEAYAVLTRLPPEYRLTPSEAVTVLRETLEKNAAIAPFSGLSIWKVIQRLGDDAASGGAAYDAFIIEILAAAGAEAIATGNAREFRRLSRGVQIIDPYERA
ncbi:MAG: PIN domain-containing protein [Spirochaetaceae bacterium]|nr:MAG: PIN domain-containing protein [Spirochaetaceae bacterium]